MATTKVKKKAPVRKKAAAKKSVAKKAAPARKKAVAKKAVAKKATPVRKKTEDKKTVTKKAAPAGKKAVAKKAVAKKAVAKKAVAKKAVAKKAVAKKAVAKKAVVAKKAKPSTLALPLPEIAWVEKELELPKFLQSAPTPAKKEIVATQQYVEKKNKYPKPVFLAIPILLLIVSFFLISPNSASQSNSKQSASSAAMEDAEPLQSTDVQESQTVATLTSGQKSQSGSSPTTLDDKTLAPRSFKSDDNGQEITFHWKSPMNTDRIAGYELFVKKSGSEQWIVISSQTPAQMEVSVDLISLTSNSQFRIASVLDTGDLVFNTATLKLAGLVE
jgi:hypothetical protein